jgi:hypothetical protein
MISQNSALYFTDAIIIATDQSNIKPDAEIRRVIRRHVMKGKNRKQFASKRGTLLSWINHENETPLLPLAIPIALSQPCLLAPICSSLTVTAMGMKPQELQLIYDREVNPPVIHSQMLIYPSNQY